MSRNGARERERERERKIEKLGGVRVRDICNRVKNSE